MDAVESGGARGINFHKGAKSKGVPVTTEGVSATGVPFRGNSSPLPSVASVDSIFFIERKKTLLKPHDCELDCSRRDKQPLQWDEYLLRGVKIFEQPTMLGLLCGGSSFTPAAQ